MVWSVWPANRGPHIDGVLAVSLALAAVAIAGVFGASLLLVLAVAWHDAAAVADIAAGRDMCVLLDGVGSEASRVFVGAAEPCPDPGEWYAVERVANGDLNGYGVEMHLVALGAALLCSGIAGVVILLRT